MEYNFEKEYYEEDKFWNAEYSIGDDNLKRLEASVNLIPKDTRQLLDIGCGNGEFGHLVNKLRIDIQTISMDRSVQALNYVKTEKRIGDIDKIPCDDNSFDCVSSLQVLEHLPVAIYSKALSELARVASKYIIISVPINEDTEKRFSKCPECKSRFNAYLHLRSFTKEKIKNLFQDFGFESITMVNPVKESKFMGIDIYQKLKYSILNRPQNFSSPICPVCGFKNLNYTRSQNKIKLSFIKKYWPKVSTPGYWIIALYQRINAI